MNRLPLYRIKYKIKRTVIHLLVRMPFLKIGRLDDIRPYYNQNKIRSLWKTFPNKKTRTNKIIIFGLRTHERYDLAVFEKVLSDVLIFNGANVQNLLCDGFLKSCDGVIYHESGERLCFICQSQKKFFMEMYPNNYIYMSSYISNEEIKSIENVASKLSEKELFNYSFMGVNISEHAINSVKKYFRNEITDSGNHLYVNVLRHNLKQAMLLIQIAKNLFKNENPTHFITLHGGYSTWGPIADYLAMNGVNVYLHNKSFNRVGCFYISKAGEDLADIVAKEEWNEFKMKKLSENQKSELSIHMNLLKQGKTTEYKVYNRNRGYNRDIFLDQLLESNTRKKFALYPHNLWDKFFINRYDNLGGNIFKDDLEWIFETVNFFIHKKDFVLVIKPHPGENTYADYTKKGTLEIITEHFGSLPENIRLINRDSPITSFNLMDKGCIGIVYTSTSGLEHGYFKKPVIVAGDMHYTRAGAAFKLCSKEEYLKILDNPQPLYEFIDNNYDIIEKYAYHYYFRQQVKIPFYRDDVWLGHCIDWNVLKNYDDFVKNDPTMNHVAQSIINKKHVMRID